MKDRELRFVAASKHNRLHPIKTLKSVPTSPIEKEFDSSSKSPFDLRRVFSGGSQRTSNLQFSSSNRYNQYFHYNQYYPLQQNNQLILPHTAPPTFHNYSTLGVDIAVEALRRRQRIYRTSSTGAPFPAAIPLNSTTNLFHPLSQRKRFLSASCVDQRIIERPKRALTITAMGHWDTLRAHLKTPKHSTVSGPNTQQCLGFDTLIPKGSIASTFSCPAQTVTISTTGVTGTIIATQGGSIGGGLSAVTSAPSQQLQHPFPAPKSKFKMAHESFRARMLQEMQDHEAVFMTKKRTADSKSSEFKGGELHSSSPSPPSNFQLPNQQINKNNNIDSGDFNKYTAQSYTIRNGVEIFGANIHNEFGVCGWILTILSYILIFLTLPISACMSIKVVQEYERAVIFRLGRLLPGGAKGPGIFFIVPCIDTYRKVDLRVLSFEVPPQEILSKDSVTVAVDAVVYFRISNATISVTNVEDASRSTKLLAQTTLRNILGTKTLAEMLSDREAISLQMQSTLDEATEPWGVKVERVEVKDVRLPIQLQRAMAAEAEAAREARAKVIVAEGEQKASRALKEAADVIAESPQAIQLRYLQTLNSISAEKNSTIIFPFPVDLLSALLHQQKHSSSTQQQPQQQYHHQQSSSTFQQQQLTQQIQSNNNNNIRSPIHKTNVFSTVVAPGTQQYQMSPGTYHSSIISSDNTSSKTNLL